MDIQIERVLSQNITLLYESLDLQAVDGSKLKRLMGSQTKPMVMDTPEVIVAVYPTAVTLIQIGDRRVRITNQQQSEVIGQVPLWDLSVKCNQLVSEQSTKLVAYGFNYDLGTVVKDGDAYRMTQDLFIADTTKLNGAIDGKLLSFVPRLRFRRGTARYDLVLEPLDPQRIKVHLNTHYESESIVLPSASQLQTSFFEEYEYLVSMVPRLYKVVE